MGWVGAAASAHGVAFVTLPMPTEESALEKLLAARPDASLDPSPSALLDAICRDLTAFYSGNRVDFDQPLDLAGRPPFFRRVWEIVQAVPWGATLSYGEVARLAGAPRAGRAVGSAMAHNPVPPLVPCHRVLRGDGRLGGFGGGLDMKRQMLLNEGVRLDPIA